MTRTALTLTTAILAAFHSPALAAQAAADSGTVVRAYLRPPAASPFRPAAPPDRVEGTVVASDSTRLLLVRKGGDTLTVPLASINELYLRGKRTSQVLTGAAVGAILGGAAGYLVGSKKQVILVTEGSSGGGVFPPTEAVVDTTHEGYAGMKTGALAGATVGALIGLAIRSYRWTKVRPEQLQLGLLPAGRGVRLGWSASF
jgi:hypothetical protein